jgi:hypothetical protein
MNIRTALIPHKHVRFCDSIIALSGYIRSFLSEPHTVDEIWALIDSDSSKWNSNPSFTQVLLAIDVLYAINEIKLVGDARIMLNNSL